jgi:lamin tail-like protein
LGTESLPTNPKRRIHAGFFHSDRRIVDGLVMARCSQRLSTMLIAAFAVLGAACAKGEELDASSNAEPLDASPSDGSAGDGTDGSSSPPEGGAEGGESGPADAGPCVAKLTINEVQTAGAGGPDDEFIELHNPGTCAVALDGYALFYRSSDGVDDHMVWSAAAGQSMQPGQFFVLGGKDFAAGADFPMGGSVALGAAGGGLGLKQEDTLVDSVGWGNASNDYVEGTAALAPESGKSIGRFPDGSDTDDNASDFGDLSPSPRKTNNAW